MLARLRERLPARGEVLGVFAAAAFVAYTWTLYISFWRLPSWFFFLSLGEIVALYAYAFVMNFAESLLLLSIALVPCLVLPQSWWRNSFVARGVVLVVVVFASAQMHLSKYPTLDLREGFVGSQFSWWLHTLWITAFLALLAGRIGWFKIGLEKFADQLSIFLYLYIPMTAIGLVVMIARNIG